MRMFRTGAGRGQLVGVAEINFYAAEAGTIDSCSVYWDSDPSFVPLLPAVGFDEWLPNLRSTRVQTDVGWGEIVGKDAQIHALGEFEDWLDRATREARGGELPLRATLPVVPEGEAESVVRAQVHVRINHAKRRVWAEQEHEPADSRDVVFQVGHKVLWDWAITGAATTVTAVEMVEQMRRQCEHYRQHGIPSSLMLREIGTAPYAVWDGHPGVALG